MGTLEGRRKEDEHVMIVPFMAKGHTIPLLHLSAALSGSGVAVTFVTTPQNSSFVRQSLPPNPNITVVDLPFPHHPSLPEGCESTDQLPSPHLLPVFCNATELLRLPFQGLLRRLSQSGSLPLCVISDFFLGWTLHECRQFGVPRVVFHGMGVFAMLLSKGLVTTRAHVAAAVAGEETFHVPGTPASLLLTAADVPDWLRELDSGDPFTQVIMKHADDDERSWGVLVNSFSELEGDYVVPLEARYKIAGARAWLAGPLCLRSPTATAATAASVGDDSGECLEWLDGRAPESVVYVSFGTQTHVSPEQLDEVAHGLHMSGHHFLLVSRTAGWLPPPAVVAPPRRGLIVRGWAPQREVLEHRSTGGFVSHCGWNSVLESLSAGVPILAWPMIAEQPLNARFVAGVLGAGLRVEPAGLVHRSEICEKVKELMGGSEKGRKARKKAEELGKLARTAVADGGSSNRCLTKLIEEIRLVAKSRPGEPVFSLIVTACQVAEREREGEEAECGGDRRR